MNLSNDEPREFREALLSAFPSYSNLEMMVSDRLDQNLNRIVSNGNLENVAFELIKWAESQGRLEELIRGAYKQNPGNLQLKAFYQKKIPKEKQLIDILELDFWKEHKNKVLTIYKSSLPDRLIERDKTPETGAKLIYDCLKIPQQENKSYSIIDKFVVSLLEDKLLINNEKLNEWRKENISDDIYNIIKNKLIQEKQQQKDKNPGLFVAIIEQGGSYILEAWLNENIALDEKPRTKWEKLTIHQTHNEIPTDEIPTDKRLRNLPNLVADWINKSAECEKALKQIHIFLPYKMINHDVDCWKSELDEQDDERIGEVYQVFIRCSERLRGRHQRVLRWEEKGRKFKSKLDGFANEIFFDANSCECQKLESYIKKEDVIAVTISNVFQQEELGKLIWKSSIPIALWIRQNLTDINNENELKQLIGDSPEKQQQIRLRDIPEEVKQKRLDYIGSTPSHIGRSLCLFWDDPDLRPSQPKLSPNCL